jgi:hypothetical protein
MTRRQKLAAAVFAGEVVVLLAALWSLAGEPVPAPRVAPPSAQWAWVVLGLAACQALLAVSVGVGMFARAAGRSRLAEP